MFIIVVCCLLRYYLASSRHACHVLIHDPCYLVGSQHICHILANDPALSPGLMAYMSCTHSRPRVISPAHSISIMYSFTTLCYLAGSRHICHVLVHDSVLSPRLTASLSCTRSRLCVISQAHGISVTYSFTTLCYLPGSRHLCHVLVHDVGGEPQRRDLLQEVHETKCSFAPQPRGVAAAVRG